MRKTVCFFCFSLLVTCYSFGQDSTKCNSKYFADTLLNKLVGQWQLSGKIGNRKVENKFSADWILNHQFIELNFADEASPPTYFATVLIGYDCINERYVVHWLDVYGGRYSETLGYGLRKDKAIEFRFEYPDAPFINKFIYDDKNDTWQFHMTTKDEDGQWKIFGDEYLKR